MQPTKPAKCAKKFRTGQQARSVYEPQRTFRIDKSRQPERLFHEEGWKAAGGCHTSKMAGNEKMPRMRCGVCSQSREAEVLLWCAPHRLLEAAQPFDAIYA